MPLILDNNFTRDSYALRIERLSLISANLDSMSGTIALTPELQSWGPDALAVFTNTLATARELEGKRHAMHTAYEAELQAAIEMYKRAKNAITALIAQYAPDSNIEDRYGFDRELPRSHGDLVSAVEQLRMANTALLAENAPYVLPAATVTALVTKRDDITERYDTIQAKREETNEAFDRLHALYDEDSKRLRALYALTVLALGKQANELTLLGFATEQPRRGGGQPDAPQGFTRAGNEFVWQPVEDATSYQLVYSDTNPAAGADMEEAYSGPETRAMFMPPAPGSYEFRVRARNANGYGDWSNTISVTV